MRVASRARPAAPPICGCAAVLRLGPNRRAQSWRLEPQYTSAAWQRGLLRATGRVHARHSSIFAVARELFGLGRGSADAVQGQLESHRQDILAARSMHASTKLKQLLRKPDKRAAWDYFAHLCDGPDVNEYHCSIMLGVCRRAEDVERVLALSSQGRVKTNQAVSTALHGAYVRIGDLEQAVETLYIARSEGILDRRVLGAIMMNALKQMLKQGHRGRTAAWRYFEQMQRTDAANDRHYAKMLLACRDISQIDGLMDNLDQSSTRPTAAIYTTLHKVYVNMGLFKEAANVLCRARHEGLIDISDTDKGQPFSIRILDTATLSATATNTLRQLCESGPDGRQSAEMYFEALSDAGFASAVHYGVIMDTCQNMSEVNMWTKHMGEHKVAFDDHTYTILHKVMTRLGNFEGAVATLRAALQEGQTTQEAAGASITTTLNELVRRGDSHSWDYFRALRRAQLASHYQFNIMLGMCSSLPAVQNLVAEMEADSVTWDAITYISLHAALVRCGEHHEAVTVLQRGCERGLVDANAQGIAATGALKHIMKDDQALSIAERAVMAQNYVALLRQAVGRVDAFQYCFLLRHCCLDTAALDNIVVELDQAGLEHDFHLCASLHRAYSRFGMSDAAATALRRLRENFADLHVARKASVDEYNIMIHTCDKLECVQRILGQMDEAEVAYDQSTYMTCYNVFERSGQYERAIQVLSAARSEGIIEAHKVHVTTVNTLRRLVKKSPRTDSARQWANCLKQHGYYTSRHAKAIKAAI